MSNVSDSVARLASTLPQEVRWDGHIVDEALRETYAIRLTYACGGVGSVPIPLPSDRHARSRAPVTCKGCQGAK